MRRIYETNNYINAQAAGCRTLGICHGCAVHWLWEAMQGRWHTDPRSPARLHPSWPETYDDLSKSYANRWCYMESRVATHKEHLSDLLTQVGMANEPLPPLEQVVSGWRLPRLFWQPGWNTYAAQRRRGPLVDIQPDLLDKLHGMKDIWYDDDESFKSALRSNLTDADNKDHIIDRIMRTPPLHNMMRKTYGPLSAEAVFEHIQNNDGFYLFQGGAMLWQRPTSAACNTFMIMKMVCLSVILRMSCVTRHALCVLHAMRQI